MKKIIKSTMLLLCSALFLTACSDDNDANPTLVQPTTFQLNTPAFANSVADLASTGEIDFTWSQPKYGEPNFPVVADYQLEVSLDNTWTVSTDDAEADETGATIANYSILTDVFPDQCTAEVSGAILAKHLQRIAKWAEDAIPATQEVYVRVSSTYAGIKIYSNIVKINVAPYYVELKDAPVDLWYMIGADIADGSWGSSVGTSIIPLQPIEGEEYDKKSGQGKLQWIGYLAGGGFKIKHNIDNWNEQIGQGAAFGTFVKNDGGSGNIVVDEPGIYVVTLNTENLAGVDDKAEIENTDSKEIFTVKKYEGTAKVYTSLSICGSWTEDWTDNIALTPCNAAVENHDWYLVHNFNAGTQFKIKTSDSWATNWGGTLVADGNDLIAFGAQDGANISITEEAKYLIVFNDITGFIRLIKQ